MQALGQLMTVVFIMVVTRLHLTLTTVLFWSAMVQVTGSFAIHGPHPGVKLVTLDYTGTKIRKQLASLMSLLWMELLVLVRPIL